MGRSPDRALKCDGGHVMARRIASIGLVSLIMLAASGALSQSSFLPEAPPVQKSIPINRFKEIADEARSPLSVGENRDLADFARQGEFAEPEDGRAPTSNIFNKYLRSSTPRPQTVSTENNAGSLAGRATHAASRMLFTRDASGRGKLNTPYLLRTLTSVAADTASRPYWRRSVSDPFGDFGSMVGNDAGMNLWHEFGPGIEQVMKSHTPRFVAKIQDRMSR